MITKIKEQTTPLPEFGFTGLRLKVHCPLCGATSEYKSESDDSYKQFASLHAHGVN